MFIILLSFFIKRLNIWCSDNSFSFKSLSIRSAFKFCAALGNQEIRATKFKPAQGNKHCAKFESTTNRWTFEINIIITTPCIQAHCKLIYFKSIIDPY